MRMLRHVPFFQCSGKLYCVVMYMVKKAPVAGWYGDYEDTIMNELELLTVLFTYDIWGISPHIDMYNSELCVFLEQPLGFHIL